MRKALTIAGSDPTAGAGGIQGRLSASGGKLYFVQGDTLVCIRNNDEPEVPDTPDGPTVGIVDWEYTFCTASVDSDGD